MDEYVYRHAMSNLSRDGKYVFDDTIYKSRALLVFTSFVMLVSAGVEPGPSGTYSVNIGLIKGEIGPWWYPYALLLLACAYSVTWHLSILRKSTADNIDQGAFDQVRFFGEVVREVAFRTFNETYRGKGKSYDRPPPNKWMFAGATLGVYKAKAKFSVEELREEMIPKIMQSGAFSTRVNGDDVEIEFEKKATTDDYMAWRSYRDIWCRRRLADWMISWFPVWLLIFSIVAMIIMKSIDHFSGGMTTNGEPIAE